MLPEETDVIAAETTAPDSSTENETTTTDAVETTAPAEEAQTVPYERFREVNERAKRAAELEAKVADLEAKLNPQSPPDPNQEAIKEQIKAMGFVSKAEIDAELARREQDSRVDQELSQLSTKYNGTDGRPKFDRQKVLQYAVDNGIGNAEVAYKAMNEKALTDWAIQQAVTKTRGVKTEGSDGSGSSQVGTTNEDLREAINKGDRTALKTLLRRVTAGGA